MINHNFVKRLITYVPVIIPFSALPIVSIGVGHLTFGRAYFLSIFFFFTLASTARRGFFKPRALSGGLLGMLAAYGVLLAASGLWAESLKSAVEYTVFYFWFLIFIFVSLASGANFGTVKSSINYWILGSLLIGVACYFEIFHHIRFPGSRYYVEEHPYMFNPTGFFYNENDLAIYLSISSIFIATKLATGGFAKSLFWWFIILWFGYVITETSSRGGFFVYVFGIAAYTVSIFFRSRYSIYRFFCWAGIAATFVFSIGVGDVFSDRATQIYGISMEEEARTALFLMSVDAATRNFGLGVGAGNIEQYVSSVGETRVENVHNWLGEVTGNAGLPGIFLWLAFLILIGLSIARRFLIRKKFNETERSLVIIFMLFPAWQFVVSSMIQYMAFWVIVSYMIIYAGSISTMKKEKVGHSANACPRRGYLC